MTHRANPIPDEYKGAVPYLNVVGGIAAIDFYKKAFGTTEKT